MSNNSKEKEDKANALNKERALFLKELSKDPLQDITSLSDKLMIDPRKSTDFVKNYLVVLAESSNEGDFQRLKTMVNHGVDQISQLDDTHITALVPLLQKYGDANLVAKYEANKAKRELELEQRRQQIAQQRTQTPTPYSHENQPQPPQQPNPTGNPNVEIISPTGQPTPDPHNFNPDEYNYGPSPFDQSQNTAEDLNKGYDYRYLSGLNRVGLIRWAGKHVPNPKPWPQNIEDFIQYFELNQDKLMVAPEVLHRELQSHFGEKTGDNMIKLITSFIRWLKPEEGFGHRKQEVRQPQGPPGAYAYGNPVQMGAQFEDPFNTYYHSEGVLPYGVDARSNSARRMIAEFEQERRREKEEKKKRDQLFEDIRMKVQMDMTNFLDKKGGNGMGAGGNPMLDTVQQMIPALLIAQVMGGKLSMEPFTDPETGKTSMRMVPSAGDSGGAAAYDPDRITAKDLMDHMMNMYGLVDKKRDENTQLQGTIIQQMLDRLDKRGSLAGEMIEMHKLYKEIAPQPALGQEKMFAQSTDMARIMLEGRKFEADKARTDKLMEFQWEQKKDLAKYDFEREQNNTELRKTMIKSISGALGSNIPTIFNLIMLLTGKNQQLPMGGGMGGSGAAQQANPMAGLMGMVGNLLGGGGMGDLGKMFGGGGSEEEEEEEEDDSSYFRIPKKKKYRNRPVSQASQGIDMSDLANMFGGGQQQQQAPPEEEMPNMGFGFGGQGAPDESNFNQGPPLQQPRATMNNRNVNVDSYTGLYDELSTPTQPAPAPTQYYQAQPQPQPTVERPVSPTVPLQTQEETLEVPTAEEMIPNAQEEDEYPIFVPENFEDYSEEQLEMLLEKGAKAEESANSYLNSVNEKLKEKSKAKKK